MMRISWDTQYMGTWHMNVPDDEVMDRLEQLSMLGFTGTAQMLDTTPES